MKTSRHIMSTALGLTGLLALTGLAAAFVPAPYSAPIPVDPQRYYNTTSPRLRFSGKDYNNHGKPRSRPFKVRATRRAKHHEKVKARHR